MPPNGYRYTYADRQRILKHVWVYGRHLVEKTGEGEIVFKGTAHPVADLIDLLESRAHLGQRYSSDEATYDLGAFRQAHPGISDPVIREGCMYIMTAIVNLEFTDAAQRAKDQEN